MSDENQGSTCSSACWPFIRRRHHVDEFWPFSRRKLLMPSAAVCLSVTILPTGPSILPDGASRRLRSRRCASTKTASRIVHSDGSATAGRAGRSSATVILARNRQESRRTYERRTFSGTDSQPCFVRRSARGRRTTWSHNATIPACLNVLLPSR